MKNNAQTITQEEWNEIFDLPIAKDLFNLKHLTATDLPSYLYGAKFTYDDPKWGGTVYTILRKYKSGEVLMLERMIDGKLELTHVS